MYANVPPYLSDFFNKIFRLPDAGTTYEHVCNVIEYSSITAIHDNISHTKYLNTSYFLKILLKKSDRYGGTLAYIYM
jgi:hypothetical protein